MVSMTVSVIAIEERYGERLAIFSVPLADKEQVFMCAQMSPYDNENRGVVIVDAKKFLGLWRSTPAGSHRQIALGSPETWQSDRKYAYATHGFSRGIKNPVPLACVSYSEGKKTIVSYKFLWFGRKELTSHSAHVSFINGITRTIWLLSNGCQAFPVECRMPSALQLHAKASVEGTRVFTLRDVGTLPVQPARRSRRYTL
jgi:hypothetical protein